jgi:microcystin degradation protein MlrC
MPRILIAECKQEVSSFNPALSSYADFVVRRGQELLERHAGLNSEIAGALRVFRAHPDLELVPGYSAQAITSGGTLRGADFSRIAAEFLAAVRAAGPVDAVYFSLHGAMGAENEADPEGYLLAETRKILGEQVPIVASFDLHGIITDQILQHCDAITIYHTYPHIDFADTGERAARLLLRILAGAVRPVTARVVIPALVRGDQLITATGLFGRMIRAAQAIEASPGGLAAGMFIGNPFTDAPELCSNVIVCTDADAARAEREAVAIAQDFWSVREQLQAHLTPLAEAVRQAAEVRSGTVVLVDAADATSSGASGDSNAILHELAAQGYAGSVLAPLVDPPAVQAAFAAGVGGTVELAVGGALDPRFTPLPISGTVRMLSDGRFPNESDGGTWYGGPTAVLEAGRRTLVITSRPVSLYDRSLFLAHGQNPAAFDLVIVKSPHCQHQFYAAWAAQMINVDAPGATSANLPTLGHTRCRRPIFPLDPDVAFEPRVRLFQRWAEQS